MSKFYVNKEGLNSEELKTGKVSYGRLVNRLIPNMVLCNSIEELDCDLFSNMIIGDINYYIDNEGNYRAQEEYEEDTTGEIHEETEVIYQYYLCDLNKWDLDYLKELGGVLLAYSNMLGLYVLMVTHYGTSWDYVMTDIEWAEYGKED